MKCKAIFFVTSLDSGGLENYLLRFLMETYTEFSEISVYCKSGYAGQLESEYLKIPNLSIIVQPKLSYLNILDYLKLFFLLRKFKYDTICDFTGNFAGGVLFFSKLAGVKNRIALYRGATDHFRYTMLRRGFNFTMNKLTLYSATSILSNSMAALDFFYPNIWKNNPKFEVIYNGIPFQNFIDVKDNLRQELNIPMDAFVIGHIGRFNEAKNHETIIQVAIELCRKYKDIYFLLCGNGVKDNLYQIIHNNLILKDRVILSNNRRDVAKVLNTLDLFYFPSLTEGQPNALLEAMLMNKPFIASDIAPHRETVPEQLTCFLIEPLDIDAAIKKIGEIRASKKVYELFNIQSWIINNYDYKDLFHRFLNRIKNEW